MSQSLTFNETTLTPVYHQNNLWIRAAELARALGYSDSRKVTHLYERNADEFTPDMTQVIEISEVPEMGTPTNLVTKARIFSLRGCHLLAMFARTPVAKAFRKWVLDVLDTLAASEASNTATPTLDPAARAELKAIVDAKLSTYPAAVQGKARGEIWSRFNRHFHIAEYAQLPASQMGNARDYLIELEVKALKALPTSEDATTSTTTVQAFQPDISHMTDERQALMLELQRLMKDVDALKWRVQHAAYPLPSTPRESERTRQTYHARHAFFAAAIESLMACQAALSGSYLLGDGRQLPAC